ncbi:MAG: DUF3078 domain-containing protein [Bacteroidia bacterium]|nr:DUF3078 domain-containing protein [Bacteroidia bacterium]
MHLAAAFLGFLFSGDIHSSIPQNTGNQFRRDSTATRIWEYGADFKFNFSLANSSPNWSSGSSNNISIAGLISAGANLKRERMSWDNTLKINVGVIANRQSDIFGDGFWSTRKNIDNVFLDSKLGVEFDEYPTLSMYGGLNFQTQLLPGYVYTKDPIGREIATMTTSFLSQGQTQLAIGTENKFYRNSFIRLGYVTLKQTYVINQELYNLRNTEVIARVQKGQFIDNEFGMQVQMGGARNFGPKEMYTAKLNYLGFLPYQTDRAILDSRIDIGLSARLTKYLNLNYTLISIFDKDLVKPGTNAWQNSWVFGLGYAFHI